MSKHTQEMADDICGACNVHLGEHNHEHMATICYPRQLEAASEEIAELHARNAELLEALRTALDESGCDGDLCAHRWHDVARAAIAKAEGTR